MRPPFDIGNVTVEPGCRRLVDLPVATLSNHTPITLPVHVVHGKEKGPTLCVIAAVHGDEVIGVEIILRLLKLRQIEDIHGTLLCVPIVNAFGFISHSRYLPDRRDLNRSFPGSATGSLAHQIAHLLMNEIVERSDVGIDLHSAAANRTNLPQIRSALETERSRELAQAFGAPVVLRSAERAGSLRQAARAVGTEMLVYEAGEGLRLDEFSARVGTRGILRIMSGLGMIAYEAYEDTPESWTAPVVVTSSRWVRAEEGGLIRTHKTTGDSIEKDEVAAIISNPYEDSVCEVVSPFSGLIIGRTNLPVVNRGDALFHIAKVAKPGSAEQTVGEIVDEIEEDPIFDEDEII